MNGNTVFHSVGRKIMGVLLILVGLFALVTPFTPGSWLAIIGLVFLIGSERTGQLLHLMLGEKWYRRLRVERYLAVAKKRK